MSDDAGPTKRERLAAVKALIAQGDDAAADELDRALDDTDRLVRFKAVEGLGKVGGDRALEILLRRMDDKREDPLLRRFAVDAVVKIGTPAAADALDARMHTYDKGRGQRIMAKKIAKMRKRH